MKICPSDRLICYADSVGMILLAVFSPIPLLNCFPRVRLPRFFAAVLNFVLPITTCAVSDAAKS